MSRSVSAGDMPAAGVQEQQPRFGGQRDGDLQLPAFPVREGGRAQVVPVGQAHSFQQRAGAREIRRPGAHPPPSAEPRPRPKQHGEQDVLQHGLPHEEAGMLEGRGRPQPDTAVHGQPRHVPPVQQDGARAGGQGSTDEAEQRGLARTVGTDDRVSRTGPYGEGHLVDGGEGPEVLRHPAQLQ
ncbi:hypothetical protein GCM10010343_09790 [Streptomyces avidinii]|nr:hypothetical protein GCM10010343_09790 [Streptomyces avidinii]